MSETSLMRPEPDQKSLQLVSFSLGGELFFGANILTVQEIIRSPLITPVPGSPGFVEGVMNLRGQILPVINLRQRLQIKEEQLSKNWVLILDIAGAVTGFVVDSVSNVIRVDGAAIEPAPESIASELDSRYISGVCEVEERRLVLLNFQRIVAQEEQLKLQEATAGEEDGQDE
ncbi:MAG: chemotaxis protein CheW [Thermodesulfobacteriota bacterium]